MTDRETTKLLKKAVAALEERANAQPCEDAISRVDALNAVTMAEFRNVAIENIKKIPNTYQKPTGKWTETSLTQVSGGDFNRGFKCSCCDYVTVVDDFNYCPHCGARMEAEE